MAHHMNFSHFSAILESPGRKHNGSEAVSVRNGFSFLPSCLTIYKTV